MEIPFFKFEASGNNYLLLQEESVNRNFNIGNLITKMANKNYGIGSDGALILSNTYRPIPYVDIYNADGSKAELCINGLRIIGKYLFDTCFKNKTKIRLKTASGIYEVIHSSDNIIVKIKVTNTIKADTYQFNDKNYQLYFLSIGNHHIYIINNRNINPNFFKRQIGKHLSQKFNSNVGLITPISKNAFSIITYERGSNITLSCGSNICGATYLLKVKKLIPENELIDVETLGGSVQTIINDNEVSYIGTANLICKGIYYI
jgi:diaminopimelate epimerase